MLFAVAVLHTFSIKIFHHFALKFPQGSVQENLLHLLSEVEIVFGLWAGVLVASIGILNGGEEAARFVEGANFTEPAFVFAIMSVAATRPVLEFATAMISQVARLLPLPREISFYYCDACFGSTAGQFHY